MIASRIGWPVEMPPTPATLPGPILLPARGEPSGRSARFGPDPGADDVDIHLVHLVDARRAAVIAVQEIDVGVGSRYPRPRSRCRILIGAGGAPERAGPCCRGVLLPP